MARTQAADYDQRREAITDIAAGMFARNGFIGTSVADLSAACGISKSLIYHYYPAKEDILFEVMWSHVGSLTALSRQLAAMRRPADESVRLFARSLMEVYNGAQSRQKVLLNELDNLPPEKRRMVVAAQREVLGVLDDWLVALRPGLAGQPKSRRPVVMMFFGMLNWTHVWYDPQGPVSADQVADLAADMFLAGLPNG